MLRTRGPNGEPLKQVLVFVNAKIECRRLARQLQKAGVNADAIHGDKTQDERMKALEGFKQGTIEVLVATDVAARGLDIVELPVVINYDVPFSAEDYMHRIGRTGRAGASGLAIMLVTGADDRQVVAIEKLTKQKFTVRPLEVERSDRRERGDRSERSERPEQRPERGEKRERYGRRDAGERVASQPAAPVDDFFTKPYEERDTETASATTSSAPEETPDQPGRKPAKVAALLGGTKR